MSSTMMKCQNGSYCDKNGPPEKCDNCEKPDGLSAKGPQFLAAFIATISSVALGTCFAWSSSALLLLDITPSEESWIASIITLGACFGAIPTGTVANKLGRKKVLLTLGAMLFLSWIGIAFFYQYVSVLCVSRFLAGVAGGGISVAAPMYVAELAEISIKGTLGTFFQVQITIGLLVGYILGGFINDFQILAVASAVLPVLFVIGFSFMPESPVYLCSKGKLEEAKRSLSWFRGMNYDVDSELTQITDGLAESSKNAAKLSDLVKCKATVKALIISLGLMMFQQLSGINAVLFYAATIFKLSGSTLEPKICTIIIGFVQVLATLGSTVLIDRAGRKVLLIVSATIMSLCLSALGFYFKYELNDYPMLPLLSVALFIVAFSIGFGPIPWMIMGELFDDSVKGIASSVSAALNWSLAFTVTKQFNNMVDSFGIGTTFMIFSAVCGAGSAFVQFVLPETKGKTVEEVKALLVGRGDEKKQTTSKTTV